MVRDREGSNFCDYFEYRKGAAGDDSAGEESAKAKLANLFKS
jgi:hypothetical protein